MSKHNCASFHTTILTKSLHRCKHSSNCICKWRGESELSNSRWGESWLWCIADHYSASKETHRDICTGTHITLLIIITYSHQIVFQINLESKDREKRPRQAEQGEIVCAAQSINSNNLESILRKGYLSSAMLLVLRCKVPAGGRLVRTGWDSSN